MKGYAKFLLFILVGCLASCGGAKKQGPYTDEENIYTVQAFLRNMHKFIVQDVEDEKIKTPEGRTRDAFGPYDEGYSRNRPVSPTSVDMYRPTSVYGDTLEVRDVDYSEHADSRLEIMDRSLLKTSRQPSKEIVKYVPVVVKKKKDKRKIISIDKGFHIPGGTQIVGKFKSLKQCMKACAQSGTCFAGDFNPWIGKCYFHTNRTACNTMSAHSKLTHFKKVPCEVLGNTRSKATLGAQLRYGLEIKGVKSISDCIKKCQKAGGGVDDNPFALLGPPFGEGGQRCFGIDYDFATHKCFFHTDNIQGFFQFLLVPPPIIPFQVWLCSPLPQDVITPRDLFPNPSVVNIIICPPTNG